MNSVKLIDEWWLEPGMGDLSMEENHENGFFWQEVKEQVIDIDLTQKKVLDFGCNRGGFLRYIYGSMPFSAAVGVDITTQSIQIANDLKKDLPAEYFALSNIDSLDTDFDCAVSTAVIYLIEDIADHARQIYERLKPGGIYFATHPDYISEPAYQVTQQKIDEFAAVKCAQNDLNTIIAAFEGAGFEVNLKRTVPQDYFSVSGDGSWYGTPLKQIEFLLNRRYAFRCVKPLK